VPSAHNPAAGAFAFDRHFLAEWERHFAGAEVHRIEDVGHYVLEDTGEVVEAFLTRTE
jgi:haloalkane dehalogenase